MESARGLLYHFLKNQFIRWTVSSRKWVLSRGGCLVVAAAIILFGFQGEMIVHAKNENIDISKVVIVQYDEGQIKSYKISREHLKQMSKELGVTQT
ncbi:hypothetical protein SAMN02745216_04142 [Desulfatibacillum alkenivorans DSM 16219]|jgi:hypothetical protein|uniref:Uncharacterized protein n=1 Tax=Desulfatibacillum alkenivorans DSM 16219 TaxID=1121393 RepID=A0A1M6VN77_9BACT|nr:hypothetical protein [Desulfatibacillum alkenivorans]SHK82948.1 hypothetical protein SAMN02745216_04142 [Desulfatibacillum alkenivorans DSM 16219]